MAGRLASVLRVVYLVFNEGHSAQAAGPADEAIRLARLLRALLPEPEVLGLWRCCCTTLVVQRAARLRASWWRWKNQTAPCDTATRSPKAARWLKPRCRSAALAPTHCKPRLRRCTAKPRARP